MALSALIPALMAERHERCFVIGWGTGVSAGELAALDATRSVRVAEISRGVIEAAPLFDVGNLAASRNPTVEIRRGDAADVVLAKNRGVHWLLASESGACRVVEESEDIGDVAFDLSDELVGRFELPFGTHETMQIQADVLIVSDGEFGVTPVPKTGRPTARIPAISRTGPSVTNPRAPEFLAMPNTLSPTAAHP